MKISDLKGKIEVIPKPGQTTGITQEPQGDGFIKSVAKDLLKTAIVKPAVRFGQAVGATGLAMSGTSLDKIQKLVSRDQTFNVPLLGDITVEGQKQFGQGGERQIASDALKSGSLYFPYGKAASAVAPFIGTGAGAIASGAAGGYLADVVSNLENTDNTLGQSFKPGLGTAIGAAIPGLGVAGSLTRRAGESAAPRIINSLIKPLAKQFSYGKDPGRAVAEMGIVGNNWDELITNISKTRNQTGVELSSLLSEVGAKSQKGLQLRSALSPIDDAMRVAARNNNSILLQRLTNIKRALEEDLTFKLDEAGNPSVVSKGKKNLDSASFQDAVEFKRRIGDMTQWTGNPSDDKLVNAALKGVYGSTKQVIEDEVAAVSPKDLSQVRRLNERYGDLTSAEVAARYRDNIVARQNLLSLDSKVAGIGAGLITAMATGGASIPAALVGLSVAALNKVFQQPAIKTRVAAFLAKTPPDKLKPLFQRMPNLQKAIENLQADIQKNGLFPGDRFLNSPGGKDIIESAKNPSMGLSIKKSVPTAQDLIDKGEIGEVELKQLRSWSDTLNGKGGPRQTNALFQFDNFIKKLGFDPKYFDNDLSRKNLIEDLIDRKQLQIQKTISDESAVSGKAQGAIPSTNLAQEARKYKSAEEFVKAQGEDATKIKEADFKGGKIKLYHQTDADIKSFDKDMATFFNTFKKNITYGNNTVEVVADIKKPMKMGVEFTIQSEQPALIAKAKKGGFDAIVYSKDWTGEGIITEVIVVDPKIIKTSHQLTDLWKKANGQ